MTKRRKVTLWNTIINLLKVGLSFSGVTYLKYTALYLILSTFFAHRAAFVLMIIAASVLEMVVVLGFAKYWGRDLFFNSIIFILSISTIFWIDPLYRLVEAFTALGSVFILYAIAVGMDIGSTFLTISRKRGKDPWRFEANPLIRETARSGHLWCLIWPFLTMNLFPIALAYALGLVFLPLANIVRWFILAIAITHIAAAVNNVLMMFLAPLLKELQRKW